MTREAEPRTLKDEALDDVSAGTRSFSSNGEAFTGETAFQFEAGKDVVIKGKKILQN